MAAFDNAVGDIGGQLVDSLTSGIVSAAIGIVLIGVLIGVIYYFAVYRKKFDITVKVISEREDDPSVYFDKGAILKDRKDGQKYFCLYWIIPSKTNRFNYVFYFAFNPIFIFNIIK